MTPIVRGHEEEWRPVEGWEGLYEVSSWGRVRSLTRRRRT
ncbi:NUMOD4 domain-containing protein [Lentzea atacamensis]